MARKRLSTILDIPRDVTPATRRWMETVKEALEVRLGRRGDPGEAAVTFNDLVDGGVITRVGRINPATGLPEIEGGGGDQEPLPPPPGPSNAVALGVFGGIHLLWDQVGYRYGIVLTEIRRGTSADFALSTLLGSSGGNSYFDIIPGNAAATHWYWVRHVNADGVTGPWSAALQATKPEDTATILQRLTDQVDETVLTPAFNARLDGLETTLSEQGDQYTLTLTNDGYVSGYTVYNTGVTSTFAVLADRFVIANALGAEMVPFIVDGGVTYLDEAVIRQGSIQEGQLGPITIGKLEKADGTPITTVGGLIRADAIDAGNLSVAEAAVFSGDVTSNNYSPGVSGWRIQQSGTVEFNEGFYRGPVEFSNVTGAGALASKDNLSYSEVTGTKPPTNADNTASNTAADTANVAGTAASTVRDQAAAAASTTNTVNDWVRPGTTLINGNKIYTGDAYVDTLQLKGQAVTIPSGAYSGGSATVSTALPSFQSILSISFASTGNPVFVQMSCYLTSSDYYKWRTRRYTPSTYIYTESGGYSNVTVLVSQGFRDTLSTSGTRGYSLDAARGFSASNATSKYRSIFALETKR